MTNSAVSEVSAELIINSLRQSSQAQYASYLRRFIKFLDGKSIYMCKELDLINFVEQLYLSGLGYSACNTARSAISTMCDMVCQRPIGKSSLVTRMLKGIFMSRPSLPRHAHIYDPDIILKYLDFDSNDVDMITLSRKVVTLLTLLSSQRVSTIHSLTIKDIHWTTSSVTITISSAIKQTRVGYHQAPLEFKIYKQNKNLCMYHQLELYIKRTATTRGNIKALWISTTLPPRSVSKQTLSNWIRFCLKQTGLLEFSPHSLRAASVSKAMHNQVNIDDILRAGGWASTSVFAKFYNLPIREIGIVSSALLGDI